MVWLSRLAGLPSHASQPHGTLMTGAPLYSRPGNSQPTSRRPCRRIRRSATVLMAMLAIGVIVMSWPRRHAAEPISRSDVTAPSVAVATVTKADLPIVLQALGTVTPLSTVTVKSQINGYLTEVAFREGQMV